VGTPGPLPEIRKSLVWKEVKGRSTQAHLGKYLRRRLKEKVIFLHEQPGRTELKVNHSLVSECERAPRLDAIWQKKKQQNPGQRIHVQK